MATYRPCGTRNFSYIQDMAIIRNPFNWVLLIIGLVLLLLSPLLFSGVIINLMNFIGITIIAVQGLNLLTGYCGQISLGQSAFMAVGAYIVGILGARYNMNFLLTLPCGALGAGLIGLLFGTPSVRIKGFYLAMATLAAQFIIPALISNPLEFITNGSEGLRVPAPQIGDFIFNTPQRLFYIIIPLTVLFVFFAESFSRTGIGRAFVAIRDDDLAAEVMGINVFRYKLTAFFICSVYAGLAGGLWAYWLRSINPDHFTLTESIWYFAMLIAGGMGSVTGACFGVIFLRVLDHFLLDFSVYLTILFPGFSASTGLQQALPPIIYGLVIVLFLVFEPRGINHRWEIIKASWRLRPFSY
jgi:branched-chain amino acid transport system permease protein